MPPRWHAVNLCCAVMTDVHGVVRILLCVKTACTYLVWKACKQGQNKVVMVSLQYMLLCVSSSKLPLPMEPWAASRTS